MGRKLILFIEDHEDSRDIYGTILYYNGYNLIVAENGKAGLEMARRHHPDLILLDLGLPDISGLDVAERLHADDSTADIPIVVLTAIPESRSGDAARAAGAVKYMQKPVSQLEVVRAVTSVIGQPATTD